MVKKLVIIGFGLTVSCAAAQSLKSQDPAPLQSGVNTGIVDNFVGPHYWYFVGGPGDVHVVVRFKSMGLFGNPIRTPLTATLYDEQRTWHVTKVVTSEKDTAEQTFTGKLDKKLKTLISIAAPSDALVRTGGAYEIEATGAVQFEPAKAGGDPIIQTFLAKLNSYGATKFLADGTVQGSDGSSGTWTAFDVEHHIYTVTIGGLRLSVKYLPGRGLVDPDDPEMIKFQELR